MSAILEGEPTEETIVPPSKIDIGAVIRGRMPPTEFKRGIISCCTKLGRRKKQEDRAVIAPKVLGNEDVLFAGVFDGTVGEYAADFSHFHAAENICGSKHFREALSAATAPTGGGFLQPRVIAKIEAAMHEGYRITDEDQIALFRERGIDYSSCTSVTALITGDLLTIAHLGDSKIVLGRDNGAGGVVGKYLTTDHKPDMPEERRRIEKSGGSLAYLHGGKPFIRGGDFTERQGRGDRPMQLNYSRAFGGKDLKPFGLLATPDVFQMQLTKADKLLLVASDGVWDVCNAETAVRRAWESFRLRRDPAIDLVDFALEQHDLKGSVDNVTVICIIFRS